MMILRIPYHNVETTDFQFVLILDSIISSRFKIFVSVRTIQSTYLNLLQTIFRKLERLIQIGIIYPLLINYDGSEYPIKTEMVHFNPYSNYSQQTQKTTRTCLQLSRVLFQSVYPCRMHKFWKFAVVLISTYANILVSFTRITMLLFMLMVREMVLQ